MDQINADVKKTEPLEEKRSKVRRRVTYAATLFLFVGGPLLVAAMWQAGQYGMAKDLFLAILAPATAVITFWFSSRQATKHEEILRSVLPQAQRDE